MAFDFLRSVTQTNGTATRDILATVVLQAGFNIQFPLAQLGRLACIFEILLGAAVAVLGAIGFLCCFGKDTLCLGTASIDEQCNSLSSERYPRVEELPEQYSDVTIRLEDGHLWLLGRHRCIVTVHTPSEGVQDAAREVWREVAPWRDSSRGARKR